MAQAIYKGTRHKAQGSGHRVAGCEPGCLILILLMSIAACTASFKDPPVTFMVADPGHFHAALVLKSMYDGVNPKVYVYAPDGPELADFTGRVEAYRKRAENPATWEIKEYRGSGFFNRMIRDKPGNVLILAGNNRNKTEYILSAVKNGIHVFSDKPMAINSDDFIQLEMAFDEAKKNGVLLYDIMTERFEITSILQKELLEMPEVFGILQPGTPEEPAVIKQSVHHFFKYVSGLKLIRPPWFFDVEQEGEGITDVTTHLVDLVQWTCFPDRSIDYRKDIQISSARHWTTDIQPAEFREITGLSAYPGYLLSRVTADSILQVYSNGEINYRIRNIHVKVSVAWNFKAPDGGGDTHFSVLKGTLARLEIRQGQAQKFRPELYVIPESDDPDFYPALGKAISVIADKYPGIALEKEGDLFHVFIPDALRTGHEAHFAGVTKNYLYYLKNNNLPEWEVPNMLAKYWLTTTAKNIAND